MPSDPFASQQAASVRKLFIPFALVLISGTAAYWNSFDGVFVYDDDSSIENNPFIRRLWPLTDAMSIPFIKAGFTVSRRPILSLSFALNRYFLGPDPWGYHLVNLAIHITSGLLLFGILRRTLNLERFANRFSHRHTWLATATAVVWVVHPLHAESVTYIVQRAESLMGMFFLLTLYLAIRGFTARRSLGWLSGSVVACAFGMGVKEVMLVAPILVALYDYVFVAGSVKSMVALRKWYYVALALPLGSPIFFAVWGWEDVRADFLGPGTPLAYAATQPGVILYYLRLAVWPAPLLIDYDWPYADSAVEIIPPMTVVALALALTAWGVYRRHWAGYLGAWYFLILAPSSSFAGLAQMVQEHRMYLSLASLVVFAVIAAYGFLQNPRIPLPQRGRDGVGLLIVALVVAVLTVLTHQRNSAYHSSIGFWTDNLKKNPRSKTANLNLGIALNRAGRHDEAIIHLEKTLQINPKNEKARYNLAYAMHKLGDYDRAMNLYHTVLEHLPLHRQARVGLGQVHEARGELADAEFHYKYVIEHLHFLPDGYLNLGFLRERQGKLQEAERLYRIAIELEVGEGVVESRYNLANVLVKQGRLAEAAGWYESALSFQPADADVRTNLAIVMEQMGNLDGAIANLTLALRAQPDHAGARSALARIRATQPQLDK